MQSGTVLLLGELPTTAAQEQALTQLGMHIVRKTAQDTPEIICQALQTADYVFFNNIDINPYLHAAQNVQLIVLAATGYDWFDIEQARQLGLNVCNLPEYSALSVVEYLLWGAFNLARPYEAGIARVQAQTWHKQGLSGRDITGKTAGILGYGHIGKLLAWKLRALGVNVLVNTTHPQIIPEGTWCALPTLLEQSDMVFVCCRHHAGNKHLLNETTLMQMKSDSHLLSITPNEIIDLDALAMILKQYPERRALLDLDPIAPHSAILACPNATITPHIAFMTEETLVRRTTRCIEYLAHHLNQNEDHIPYISQRSPQTQATVS